MKDQAIKLFGKEIPLPVKNNISGGDSVVTQDEEEEEEQIEEIEKDPPSAGQIVEEEEEEQIEEIEKDPPSAGQNPIEEDEEGATAKQPSDDNNNNKTLKKPDKILPCPRCKSMDTKFCYYNNYNVNQPRHFCKSCQRYWTSGGTMRNVPVGAGRRKNKTVPTAAVCRHITISDALQAAQMGIVHHTGFNPNTTVLSFGPPEPMGSDEGTAAAAPPPHPPIPYLAGVPWPSYPLPAFYHNGLPIVQSPLWNCSFPNSWAIPSWLSPPYTPPPSLGKHSREGELIKDREASIVIPKTLRIDDPDEAARSSIWTTLGIKNDSIKRGSLFKGFESKDGEKKKKEAVESAPPETSPAMMANPAALSRSVRLQEGF